MKVFSQINKAALSLKRGFLLLITGHAKTFLNTLKTRFYSKSVSLGLRRDITTPFKNPKAKINLSIRPFEERDLEPLLDYGNLKEKDPRLAEHRIAFIEKDMPTCYIAEGPDGKACYMQWLIGNESNEEIQNHFKDVFPTLDKDEALLEGALVPESFRGLWIMPAAMAQIACKASNLGARWVITFVDIENIPSLKGCKRAGFSPYLLRMDRWILFKRFTSFKKISDKLVKRYEEITS